MQFIISLTKINFSKENIIYYTRLHDSSMTRMLFSYPIIRAFNNNNFLAINFKSFYSNNSPILLTKINYCKENVIY